MREKLIIITPLNFNTIKSSHLLNRYPQLHVHSLWQHVFHLALANFQIKESPCILSLYIAYCIAYFAWKNMKSGRVRLPTVQQVWKLTSTIFHSSCFRTFTFAIPLDHFDGPSFSSVQLSNYDEILSYLIVESE